MSRRSQLLPLLISGSVALVAFAWFARGYHGPDVVPATADATQFSAARALERLARILGDQTPHPAGSPQNEVVRQRLLQELADLNLEVEQTPFQVNGVEMTNVLAVLRGDPARRPLLLATHYDSVAPGPGAGDAGSCVAALLETARLLQHVDRTGASDVWFLFTDGEEWVQKITYGLNGAREFAEQHPHELLQREPLILNFDARGATGPSVLYETSGQNLALLQHVLAHLPRPAYTASSYVSVYELLPNATDFTIFKRAGGTGLNFAFLDDPHRYHTSDDSLETLDARSVQHHGENAAAMAQLMMRTEPPRNATENAVFFTLLNQWLICYPESWAPALAAVLLVIQLVGVWRRRSRLRWKAIALTVVHLVLILMLGIMAGRGIMSLNDYRPQSWHGFGPYDPAIVAGQWAVTFAVAALVLWLARQQTDAENVWAVVWTGNAIVGLLVAWWLPGFSYIMLTIGVVPAFCSLTPGRIHWLCVPVIVAASVLQVPLAYQFGVALGPKMAFALGGLFVLFLLPFFPLLVPASEPAPE